MSGDLGNVSLTPVVTALQTAITPDNIVSFFATGVMVALPLILTWFRMQVDLQTFYKCSKTAEEARKSLRECSICSSIVCFRPTETSANLVTLSNLYKRGINGRICKSYK